MQDNLITFSQLLQIKREKLGLTLKEAADKSQVSTLPALERGKATPTKKTMFKLMSFYKITEEELNTCKKNRIDTQSVIPTNKKRIPVILDLLESVIKDVESIQEKGVLAKNMKENALSELYDAVKKINDVSIIDRII